MFDSTLCDRPFPQHPFFIHWLRLEWLNKPLLVIILLLAFFGLYGIIRHTPWKRWLNSPKTIFLLFVCSVTAPLMLMVLAEKGLVVFLPTDSGTTTDAIVVLGRGELFDEQRVNLAAQLWQAKRAPRIFVSGRSDAHRTIKRLEARGIPQQVLDGENCSLTTQENAVFTATILQHQGISRILLITDEPHMLRSLLVFRAYGFTVIPRTSTISSNLFNNREKAFLYLKEYPGLINYALRGLFLSQPSPELSSPELVNILQQAKQYERSKINY